MARWDKITSMGRVQDRRGVAPVVGGIGIGGILLYVGVNFLLGGNIDVGTVLDGLNQVQVRQSDDGSAYVGDDNYEVFAGQVLGSNNTMWRSVFESSNMDYREPTLVLFRDSTESSCGVATSRVGPHYCSLDETIYLDETFFDELQNRYGAEGGDVAEAYVIAHEAAHHAQYIMGTMDLVQRARQTSPDQANELSVSLELQADCYAGLWANSVGKLEIFEPGEIREAMDAAESVGDDRIQESVTGQVNPETWTHGSSDQRVEWFSKGYESGSLESCGVFE